MRRHVLTRWGDRLVSDVLPSDIRLLSKELDDAGLSKNTRRLILVALKRFLNAAVEDGLLSGDVVEGIKIPVGARKNPDDRRTMLDLDQARALLTDMTRADQSHPAAPLLVLGLLSGARRGELVGARWEDIDMATATWTIERSVTKADGRLCIDAPNTSPRAERCPCPGLSSTRWPWRARRTRSAPTWPRICAAPASPLTPTGCRRSCGRAPSALERSGGNARPAPDVRDDHP